MMDFNEDLYYLGTLCKRGHIYPGLEMSLRYKKSRGCVECNKIRIREHRRLVPEDIPKKCYLGRLCKHGHSFPGTCRSLRYKSNKSCVECNHRKQKTLWVKEKRKRRRKEYNARDEVIERRKMYSQSEAVLKRIKIYNQRPEVKEAHRRRSRQSYHNPDMKRKEYLRTPEMMAKKILSKKLGLGYKEIPKEIIKIKATQLVFSRELRALKKNLNRKRRVLKWVY